MSDTMAQALPQGQMAVSRGNTDLARQWLEQAAALEPTIGVFAFLVLAGAKLMLKSGEAPEFAHRGERARLAGGLARGPRLLYLPTG
jgi:hypothetical protein